MLSLSVYPREKVYIGDGWIAIGAVRGEKVRLSFNFPPEVTILRGKFVDGKTVAPSTRRIDLIREEAENTIAVASAKIKSATDLAIQGYWRGERMASQRTLAILNRDDTKRE